MKDLNSTFNSTSCCASASAGAAVNTTASNIKVIRFDAQYNTYRTGFKAITTLWGYTPFKKGVVRRLRKKMFKGIPVEIQILNYEDVKDAYAGPYDIMDSIGYDKVKAVVYEDIEYIYSKKFREDHDDLVEFDRNDWSMWI